MILKIFLVLVAQAQMTNGQCGDNCQLNYPPKQNLKINLELENSDERGNFQFPGISSSNTHGTCKKNPDGSSRYETKSNGYTVIITKDTNCGPNFIPGYVPSPTCDKEKVELKIPVQFLQDLHDGRYVNTDINWIVLLGLDKVFKPIEPNEAEAVPTYDPSNKITATVPMSVVKYLIHMLIESQKYGKKCEGGEIPDTTTPHTDTTTAKTTPMTTTPNNGIKIPTPPLPSTSILIPHRLPNPGTNWETLLDVINPNGWIKIPNWIGFHIYMNGVRADGSPMTFDDWKKLITDGWVFPQKDVPFIPGWKVVQNMVTNQQFWINIVDHYGTPIHSNKWPTIIIDTVAGPVIDSLLKYPELATVTLQVSPSGELNWTTPYYHLPTPDIERWNTLLEKVNPHGWLKLEISPGVFRFVNIVNDDGTSLSHSELETLVHLGFTSPWDTLSEIPPTSPPGFKLIIENVSHKRYWLIILSPDSSYAPRNDWPESLKHVVNLGPNPSTLSVTVNPDGNPSWPGIIPTYNPQIKWQKEVLSINPNGWFRGTSPNGITVYINFVFENGNPLTPEEIIKIFNRPWINIWLNAVDDNWRNPGWKVVQTYVGQSVYLNILYENGSPVEPNDWYDIITNLIKSEIVPDNYLTPAIRYVITVPYPNGPLQWTPLPHHPQIFLVTIVDKDGKPYNPNGWQWIVDKFSNTYIINPMLDNCTPWIRKNFNAILNDKDDVEWVIDADQYNVPVSIQWPRWVDKSGNEFWLEAVDDKMEPQDITNLWNQILLDSEKVYWMNYFDFNKNPILERGWQQVYHPLLKQYVCLNSFTEQGQPLYIELKQQFIDTHSNTYIVNLIKDTGKVVARPEDTTIKVEFPGNNHWTSIPDTYLVPGSPWIQLNETVLFPLPGSTPMTFIPMPGTDITLVSPGTTTESTKPIPIPTPTLPPYQVPHPGFLKWPQLLDVINPHFWIQVDAPCGRYYVNGVTKDAVPMTIQNWLDLISNGFVSNWLETTDPYGKLWNPIGWKDIEDRLSKHSYFINIIDERGYPVSPEVWPTIISESVLKPSLVNRPNFETIVIPSLNFPVFTKPEWPAGIDSERWNRIFHKINPDGWFKLKDSSKQPVCINIVKDDSSAPNWSELQSLTNNGFTSPWDNQPNLMNASEPYGFKLIYEKHNFNRFYVLMLTCDGEQLPRNEWETSIREIVTLGPSFPKTSVTLNVTEKPQWPDGKSVISFPPLKWEKDILSINPKGWYKLEINVNDIIYFNFIDENGKPLTPQEILTIFSNPWNSPWLYDNTTNWNSYGWKVFYTYLGHKYYLNILTATGYPVSPDKWTTLITDLLHQGIFTPDLTIPVIRYEIRYDPETQRPTWVVIELNPNIYFVVIVDEQGTPYNPNGIQQIVDKFSNVYFINPIHEDLSPLVKDVFQHVITPADTQNWVIRNDRSNKPISLKWPRFTDTNQNTYHLYSTTTQNQPVDITRLWTTIIQDSKGIYWSNWYDRNGKPLFDRGWQLVYNPIQARAVFLNSLTDQLSQTYRYLMKVTSDLHGNMYLVNNVDFEGKPVPSPVDTTITLIPEVKIPEHLVLPGSVWPDLTQEIYPEEVPIDEQTSFGEQKGQSGGSVVPPMEITGETKYEDKLHIINPNRWLSVPHQRILVNIINEDASPVENIEISTLLRNGWTSNWSGKSDNPAGWKLIIENTTAKRYFINIIDYIGKPITPAKWPEIFNSVILEDTLSSGTGSYKTIKHIPPYDIGWYVDLPPAGFDTLRWETLLTKINYDGWKPVKYNNTDYLLNIVKDDASSLSETELSSLVSNQWDSPWEKLKSGAERRGWKLIIENNLRKRYWIDFYPKDSSLHLVEIPPILPDPLNITITYNVTCYVLELGPGGKPVFHVDSDKEDDKFVKWSEFEKLIEINPNGWLRTELKGNVFFVNFVDYLGAPISPSDIKFIFTQSWSSPFIAVTDEKKRPSTGAWEKNGWKQFKDYYTNEIYINLLYSTGARVDPQIWYDVISQIINKDFTSDPPVPLKYVIKLDTNTKQLTWEVLNQGANIYYVTIVDQNGVPFNPNGWHKIVDKYNTIYIVNPVDKTGNPMISYIFEMQPNSFGSMEWRLKKLMDIPISQSWFELNDSVNIFRIFAVDYKTKYEVDITEKFKEIIRDSSDIAWINARNAEGYFVFSPGWPTVYNADLNENVYLNALAENQSTLFPNLFQQFTDSQSNVYFVNKYDSKGQQAFNPYSLTVPQGNLETVNISDEIVIKKNPFADLLLVISTSLQISPPVLQDDLVLVGVIQKLAIEDADLYIDLKGTIWLIPKPPLGVIYTEVLKKELSIQHNQPVFTLEDNDDPKTEHEIVLDPSTGNIVIIPRINLGTKGPTSIVTIVTRADLQKFIDFYGKVFVYHNQPLQGKTKLIRDRRGGVVEIPEGQWEWREYELQILINRPGALIFKRDEKYSLVQLYIALNKILYEIPAHPAGKFWSPLDAELLSAIVGTKIAEDATTLSIYRSEIVTDGRLILFIPLHPLRKYDKPEIEFLIKSFSKVFLMPGQPYDKVSYVFDGNSTYVYKIPRYPKGLFDWPPALMDVIMKYYAEVYLKPGDTWDGPPEIVIDQFQRKFKIPKLGITKTLNATGLLNKFISVYGIKIQDMECKPPPKEKLPENVLPSDLPDRPSDFEPEQFIAWLKKECGWSMFTFSILPDKRITLTYIGVVPQPSIFTSKPEISVGGGVVVVTDYPKVISGGTRSHSSMVFSSSNPVVINSQQFLQPRTWYREGTSLDINQGKKNEPLIINAAPLHYRTL